MTQPDETAVARPQYELSEPCPVIGLHLVHAALTPDRWDMHYGLEFGIVLSGGMRRFTATHTRDLAPGDAWLCSLWETHGYRIIAVPCEVVVLVLWPPALAGLRFEESPEIRMMAPFLARPEARPVPDAAGRVELLELGARLRDVINTPSRPRSWLRLLAWEALLLLCERWRGRPTAGTLDDHRLIARALPLAFAAAGHLNQEAVAAQCGLSRNAFARHFQRAIGMSFATFARRCRLSRAARDLLASHSPLKQVATTWGFEDASHFCRIFRRTYGMTPAAYRNGRRPDKQQD